jgi:hypothetical protein
MTRVRKSSTFSGSVEDIDIVCGLSKKKKKKKRQWKKNDFEEKQTVHMQSLEFAFLKAKYHIRKANEASGQWNFTYAGMSTLKSVNTILNKATCAFTMVLEVLTEKKTIELIQIYSHSIIWFDLIWFTSFITLKSIQHESFLLYCSFISNSNQLFKKPG